MTFLSTLATIAIGVSAALTPLGLYDSLELRESAETTFVYVRDNSPIGRATPSRQNYSFDRVCGLHTSCPGNDDGFRFIKTELPGGDTETTIVPVPGVHNRTVHTSIASNISEAFMSATANNKGTIAGVFDIQYRFFSNFNE